MKRRDFLKGAVALGGISLFSAEALAAALEGSPKTIVVGATAEGCGLALKDPANTVVLERGIHPAAEFLLSLDPETPGVAQTETSKAFEKMLKDRNLIEGGRLYHQPVADLLTTFLDDRGVKLLFAVEFVDARKLPSGSYMVTVCGADGKVSFEAARVMDLRYDKTLAMSGVLAKKGTAETRIFRVPLPERASISQARLMFHDAWEKQAKDLPDWELVAEAGSIKYDTGHADFFSALDAGLTECSHEEK